MADLLKPSPSSTERTASYPTGLAWELKGLEGKLMESNIVIYTPAKEWSLRKWLTIRESAAIISNFDPMNDFNDLPRDLYIRWSLIYDTLVEYFDDLAIQDFIDDTNKVQIANRRGERDYDQSKILNTVVIDWAQSKGYTWPFQLESSYQTQTNMSEYPQELVAAIESFNAVKAMKIKSSPKSELKKWLTKHKDKYGGLSAEAINRISTVSNWQKDGGAPRTDGQVND